MKQKGNKNITMPRMAVEIGGLTIKNPVMTASGTFGYGEEYSLNVDISHIGAVIVKGISLEPRIGNPPPRIIETPCGMLNAIGLENPGVRVFVKDKLPFLRQYDGGNVCKVSGIVFAVLLTRFQKTLELPQLAFADRRLELGHPVVETDHVN